MDGLTQNRMPCRCFARHVLSADERGEGHHNKSVESVDGGVVPNRESTNGEEQGGEKLNGGEPGFHMNFVSHIYTKLIVLM